MRQKVWFMFPQGPHPNVEKYDVTGHPPESSIYGITRNFLLLRILPLGRVTFTYPVVAPTGTVAWIWLFETTVNAAGTP